MNTFNPDILYPLPDDFKGKYPQDYPALFYYTCLNGVQLFFRKNRNDYEVYTRGFRLPCTKAVRYRGNCEEFICYNGVTFEFAKDVFFLAQKELFNSIFAI